MISFSLLKKKKFHIFFAYFILFFLIFYDLRFTTFNYDYNLIIKPNQSLRHISKDLYQYKIIQNKSIFEILVYINFAEKKLKAGEYNFYKDNIFKIVKKIKKGDVFQRKFTIAEGLSSLEVINILRNIEGIEIDTEIQIPEEGSLFPDTYFFVYGTKIKHIISKMQVAMNKILKSSWENRNKKINLKNHKEVLILASIVEKETSMKEEKAIVAQVFLNRLDLKMKLQSDPTVIYGITKQKGEFNRELTKKDLNFDSEYNTYLNYGLPKNPISNPGKDSIIAVTNPAFGNLLYFVADGTGGHVFSTSYKEHLNNIKKIKNN